MTSQLQKIDDDIFTVSEVFDRDECSHLIARAESLGFEAASVRTSSGSQMLTHIRNNDRVVFDDVDLAGEMWERIRTYFQLWRGRMPVVLILDCVSTGIFQANSFKRHRDGAVTNELGQTSKLSY